MRPNLDGRRFRGSGGAGDVGPATIFLFTQRGDTVWAAYAGGTIAHGHLLALMDAAGNLEIRYHHVTTGGVLKSGMGRSHLSAGADGLLAYDEVWEWTGSASGSGSSRIEEF